VSVPVFVTVCSADPTQPALPKFRGTASRVIGKNATPSNEELFDRDDERRKRLAAALVCNVGTYVQYLCK
jgi:hypothetical protein